MESTLIVHRATAWVRSHKAASVGYAFLLLFLSQYVMLPNNSLQDLRKENPGVTALMKQRIDEADEGGKKFSLSIFRLELFRFMKRSGKPVTWLMLTQICCLMSSASIAKMVWIF